jgi:hypothetical protein
MSVSAVVLVDTHVINDDAEDAMREKHASTLQRMDAEHAKLQRELTELQERSEQLRQQHSAAYGMPSSPTFRPPALTPDSLRRLSTDWRADMQRWASQQSPARCISLDAMASWLQHVYARAQQRCQRLIEHVTHIAQCPPAQQHWMDRQFSHAMTVASAAGEQPAAAAPGSGSAAAPQSLSFFLLHCKRHWLYLLSFPLAPDQAGRIDAESDRADLFQRAPLAIRPCEDDRALVTLLANWQRIAALHLLLNDAQLPNDFFGPPAADACPAAAASVVAAASASAATAFAAQPAGAMPLPRFSAHGAAHASRFAF